MDEGQACPLWLPGRGDTHLSQRVDNTGYPLLLPCRTEPGPTPSTQRKGFLKTMKVVLGGQGGDDSNLR